MRETIGSAPHAVGDAAPRRTSESDALFAGPGEMRALCRALDWAATPLGPVDGWSRSLRTAAGIVLASRNPMFLWWGPQLVQLYNDAYRPSLGGAGRHPHALGARGREFWTDIWEVIGPQIGQVMSGGDATWHEDQYLPIERDGRLDDVWWTYGYSPVHDDDGSVGGTLVVCQETTGRVLAERERERLRGALDVERARLAYVFQHAPSFLAVMRGPSHQFELVNDALYQLVGRRPLVGRPVFEALPELRDQGFRELLDRVLHTGEPFVGRDVPVTVARTPGASPEERFVDLTYMPLVEADGTRSGVIAHGTDVTEQVRARREVERLLGESERARTVAEAADQAKSQFLANMSHELRTPLNAIGGYAELLEIGVRGPVSDAQRDDLARIRRSQRHLLGLVNEVLHYARLEAGTVGYDLADVHVLDVLLEAEGLVAPQASAKGLALDIGDCPPDLLVRADPEKVRQILVNLLSNAVKFTERGGAVVEVSCADDGRAVVVRVRDTGIGIAADQLERIFAPFVQVRAGLTRTAEGVGLGLAISRDLARGMGGDLAATSEPGVGSTFTLTLPRA